MFAVIAVYQNGRHILLGFAKDPSEADAITEKFIATHGKEHMERHGVRFHVELAI